MRSGAKLYLRLLTIGCVSAVFLQLCACHKTVMVFGPSAPPAAFAPPKDSSPREIEAARAAAAKRELPGIPFYTYRGVCNQETVWLEPRTSLTLTVTVDGGKPVTRSITVNNVAFHDANARQLGHPDVQNLVNSLAGQHTIKSPDSSLCPDKVAKAWNAIEQAYPPPLIDDSDPRDVKKYDTNHVLIMISNTASTGTAVDYSRVYYLNAKSPLMGSATVDAKLNSDGTLGEGSTTVDNETLNDVMTAAATAASAGLTAWSTIKSAEISGNAAAPQQTSPLGSGMPAKINKSRTRVQPPAKPACAATNGWPEVMHTVTYQVTITPGGFLHDHKKATPLEDEPGGKCVASPVYGGSFTVTPVNAGSKSDKNAIGVSGTITLPKAMDRSARIP